MAYQENQMDENMLSDFYCAFSNDEHFLIQPIKLSCNHHICKSCIPSGTFRKKCRVCNKINKIDLRLRDECKIAKQYIGYNLEHLFDETQTRFLNLFEKFKETKSSIENSINIKIEYLREEIELRIESIKCELDKLSCVLNNKLDGIRDDLFTYTDESSGVNISQYEKEFDRLNCLIKDKSKQSELEYTKYQKQIKNLNQAILNMKEFNHQLKFRVSDAIIDLNLIGTIECNEISVKRQNMLPIDNSIINRNEIFHNHNDLPDLSVDKGVKIKKRVDEFLKTNFSKSKTFYTQEETDNNEISSSSSTVTDDSDTDATEIVNTKNKSRVFELNNRIKNIYLDEQTSLSSTKRRKNLSFFEILNHIENEPEEIKIPQTQSYVLPSAAKSFQLNKTPTPSKRRNSKPTDNWHKYIVESDTDQDVDVNSTYEPPQNRYLSQERLINNGFLYKRHNASTPDCSIKFDFHKS